MERKDHAVELRDREARRKIEQELDTNFLVEAGAGSGKTTSLVKRMTRLVSSGTYRVEEIAAITFTRKAAAELREKFQDSLEQAYSSAADPQNKQILGEALMNLDRCFVGTIHSFCARLLRERPVEAGIEPGFEELDEVQEALLQDRAWQEYLLWVRDQHPSLLERVEEIGVYAEDLKDLFDTFSYYPEVEIPLEEALPPDFAPALQELDRLIEEALPFIPEPPHENRFDKLQEQILQAHRGLKRRDLDQPSQAAKILADLDKRKDIILKLWLEKDKAKEIKASLEDFCQTYAAPLLRQWREYCYYHIASFLLPARNFLADFKDRHSRLGFHDLLMKAAGLLREFPEVRHYFQIKYRCLLVDEFQDTDPLQSEMMFCLTGTDLQEKNWQRLSPRSGSLFVVGDPKQSIYRFRRADMDTYNLVKGIIKNSGGEVLNLNTNFRCLKPLEEFTNQVFQAMLAPREDPYQAPFAPIDAFRTQTEDSDCGVKVLPVEPSFSRKEEVVAQDAWQVASYIAQALKGNLRLARSREETRAGLDETPRPGDFLIILRFKEMMDTYARALEEQGIPVTMTGGSSLSDSFELKELLKLLKYLDDPPHQVYLVAVLKGLFFGISDDQLYHFQAKGGKLDPLLHNFLRQEQGEKGAPSACTPDYAAMDQNLLQLFDDAFKRLGKFLKWKWDYPPAVVLEKVMEDLGLVPYTLSLPLGERNCSYLYQVLEYVRQDSSASGEAFRDMVEQIETLINSGVEEELELETAGKEAVRLMNLHKAKGLEAPVVMLAHPYKRREVTVDHVDRYIERTGEMPVGYFAFSRKVGQYASEKLAQPPRWDVCAEEEQKYQQAEETRLLYVAATRARNLLVISNSEKHPGRNPWRELLEYADQDKIEELSPPQLPPLEGKAEEASREVGKELSAFRENLEDWISRASRWGWSQLQPSEIRIKRETGEEAPTEPVAWLDERRSPGVEAPLEGLQRKDLPTPEEDQGDQGGLAWGSLLHRGLEALVKGEPDLEGILGAELVRLELPPKYLHAALRNLEHFQRTSLWEEIRAAGQECYAEVPFSLYVNPGEYLYTLFQEKTDDRLPVVVNGIIDLAYLGQGGWVMVDYKTDRVDGESDLRHLIERYTPQIHAYARAWEELSGEKVARGELYFLYLHRSFPVYYPSDQIT